MLKLYPRKVIFNNLTSKRRLSAPSGAPAKVDYLGIAFFSSITLGTVALGWWQTNRYFEKVNMIQKTSNILSNEPIDIPADFNASKLHEWSREYVGRRVSLVGNFDHSKEFLLGLRSAPNGLYGSQAQGLSTNPQGYYVITPMKLPNGCVRFPSILVRQQVVHM